MQTMTGLLMKQPIWTKTELQRYFDTNNNRIGSPRDLNRKLFLEFDGRNDYVEAAPVLGGLSNATLMAWVNLAPGLNPYRSCSRTK